MTNGNEIIINSDFFLFFKFIIKCEEPGWLITINMQKITVMMGIQVSTTIKLTRIDRGELT